MLHNPMKAQVINLMIGNPETIAEKTKKPQVLQPGALQSTYSQKIILLSKFWYLLDRSLL